jgi:glycosyltransferase involved in cell wall biosynthesis
MIEPRIGLLYPTSDPVSPGNWSGTPFGLFEGLRAQGARVVPVPLLLPGPVRLGVAAASRLGSFRPAVAHRSGLYADARTVALARSLHRARPLDALLAMDTELYDLPRVLAGSALPVATYDDGTFALFLTHPDSDVRREGFPPAAVRRWAARQARACRVAQVCCLSTSWARQSVIDDYQVAADRVRVVGMGHRPRVLPGPGRDHSSPRYLFVGIDWGRKNGDQVLAAFAQVRRTHPKATLDVVGNHPRLDLAGVVGHGFLPRERPEAQRQLDRLFQRATAFVLPSRFDPSPIAYLEAASAGLPVIATTEGGAGELLGAAALSVHPDDRPALVAAMLRLADPRTARDLGAEAARRASDSTWAAVAGRILGSLRLAGPLHHPSTGASS